MAEHNIDSIMTETSNPNPDKNQHITEYLEYYINQKEPADSAILLTGSWGWAKLIILIGLLIIIKIL